MIKPIKEWLKARLRKAVAIPPLEERLEQEINLLHRELENIKPFTISPWYQENLWEPSVQIAIRDLCKPGDIVFDVGANFAGLTTVMSRCVGPKGVVCAFEASPRIIDKCQRNLVWNGCSNVQLYHAAIYHQSYGKVPIYLRSHLNDSIYTSKQDDVAAYYVPTIALDDFVQQTGLVPNFVKMDIEDAEFDAVKGMLKTLATAKPHLILETPREDARCLKLLQDKGYIAIDLNSYREVKSPDDYPLGVEIRNNLYIHRDRCQETPYNPPFEFVELATLTAQDFDIANNGSVYLKNLLQLDKGRYLIDVNFTAEETDNEMVCGVKARDKLILCYHAYSSLLASSYYDWVIDLSETTEVNLYFEFCRETYDPTFTVKGAKVVQIADFSSLPAQLYF